MALKFFTIPTRSPELEEGDLHKFLASHRVLAVDRQFVDDGANSFWTVCVDYLTGPGPSAPLPRFAKKERVDYRERLKPDDFTVGHAPRRGIMEADGGMWNEAWSRCNRSC